MLWIAALLSLGLSGIALWMDPPLLAMDGLYYLKAAEAFVQHGIKAAFEVYHWPFYSILIGSISKLTGLSLDLSACLIDALGFMLIVLGFVGITQAIGASERIQRWAVALILLYPALNIMRKLPVLRDYMAWGALLMGVWALLAYCQKRSWQRAFAWNVAMLVAVLFRFENIALMFLLPLCVYSYYRDQAVSRICNWLPLNIGVLACIAASGVWLLTHWKLAPVYLSMFHHMRDNGLSSTAGTGFAQHVQDVRHWFQFGHTDYIGPMAVVFAGILYFILNFVNSIGLVFFSLVTYGVYKRVLKLQPAPRRLFKSVIVIELLILIDFMVMHYFVSYRYFMPLNFILLLWVPFALDHLYEKFNKDESWRVWPLRLFPIVMACLSLLAINGLYRGRYSKAYVREAASWADQNLPPQSRLFSNDLRLLYYTHRVGNPILRSRFYYQNPKHRLLSRREYFLISVSRHQMELARKWQALFKNPPVKTFTGPRGEHVYVWKK